MALKQDWLMKQIQELVNFLIFLILGRDGDREQMDRLEQQARKENPLYGQMVFFVEENQIGKAEDLLFDAMENGEDVFDIGILFYARINALSDDNLQRGGFSRREIMDGITDFCEAQKVDVSNFLKVKG